MGAKIGSSIKGARAVLNASTGVNPGPTNTEGSQLVARDRGVRADASGFTRKKEREPGGGRSSRLIAVKRYRRRTVVGERL